MKAMATSPDAQESIDQGRRSNKSRSSMRLNQFGFCTFNLPLITKILALSTAAFISLPSPMTVPHTPSYRETRLTNSKKRQDSLLEASRKTWLPFVLELKKDGRGVKKNSLPVYWMTSPDAKRFETRVILTLTWSPGFVFGTKTTRPSTRAIPSPRLLISLMSTSYSLPSSTGFGPKRFAPPP